MRINNLLKLSLLLVFTVTFLMAGALIAEAQRGQYQRGQYMMEREYDQLPEGRWELYGPEMTWGQGMRGPGMDMMPGMGMMGYLDLPGLTDEQRNEIRAVQRQSRREHREIMLDMMDKRDDYLDALAEDRPDPEKVRELHRALGRKQGEMIESSLKTRNQIYDLLTEEQREQLREVRQRPFGHPYRDRWIR